MTSQRLMCRVVALLGIGVGVLAAPALAQDCPEPVGTLPGNFGRAIAVSGDYAYLGGDVFRVIDVSNPSAPVEVGFTDPPGAAWDIAVEGTYAFVGSFSDPFGLQVIDVTSPTGPLEVGFLPTPDSALGVAVSQGFAYVANGGAGLRVIDVTTPALPFEVSFLDPPGWEWDVAVAGGYAYLIADVAVPPYGGFGRLSVIDVSNPSAPVEVGYLEMWDAQGVAVSGGHAYVADVGFGGETGGLRVIDVSTPSAPVEVGFYQSIAYGVAVSDGYVFLVTDGGLYVFRECPFFSDGFESGDTSAWSATVP